ncbi:DUF2079 domain-containing protein [Synechococcus sp. CBW1004]|uniref:DUF2079 domain-containing protein n=1 Tax=Synechococcus sp. CBW1004 TaxID=1353136 RepID=UPI0018CFE155|nr:DUF2079 domain-containing protein [Synechococcus sp. CBW1004]QPN63515.1 DUF2079 domain-containing protein [Synechococcus sp. CBW1004]
MSPTPLPPPRLALTRLSSKAGRAVALAALLFAVTGLSIQLWRLLSLTASYDQGIFTQVLWNTLRGHPFESTLSSQLSTNVIHAGQPPALGYQRLGQHFTPLLLLWAPLVGTLGSGALGVIQVLLVTAAGLTLHRLARHWLPAGPAALISISFFAANAVIGPAWGNFTDLCQLPLLVFLLLLGLETRRTAVIAVAALLIPLVREDTGVVLMGVSLWLLVRQRQRWPLALLLLLWGGASVLLAMNVWMPQFSDDNARRFMVENFGHYIEGQEEASSLEVLRSALGQPPVLLRELVNPPDQTLRYLIGLTLPLMLVPLVSIDAWLLISLPMLGLLLARGSNNPLSINIRYTYLVVPGLYAGAALWWQRHLGLFQSRRLRRVWMGCMALSLIFTLTSNPNRSISWLVPDSVSPWVHVGLQESWQRARQSRLLLQVIPPGVPVAASTHLVPPLARREVLVRFPQSITYLDRGGREQPVDWVAVDLERLRRYAPAFEEDRDVLQLCRERLQAMGTDFGIQALRDGVVILERGAADVEGSRDGLEQLLRASDQG